jgi:FKBP-type peptidyl-prolyl cis-trans isomerase
MTLPARRPGRSFLILGAAAALLTAGTLAVAQQPQAAPAPAAGAAPAATPAKPAKPAAGQSADKPAKAEGDKAATSYSLGVIMGAQLRKAGVHPSDVSSERLTAGFRDALNGKVTLGENDQNNVNKLLHGAYDASIDTNHRAAAKFLAENGKKPGVITTASGLEYKVITPGSGDSPKPSDEATVNYRGSLLDGTEFDSSYTRGKPATFGVGRVIPGWTEALQLMKPGSKYQLWIPPQLAYDTRPPQGAPIPPGAMLVFDVELISVKAPAAPAAPSAIAPPAPAQPK